MSEKNGAKSFLGLQVPRREPIGEGEGEISAKRKGGLMPANPLVKEVRSYVELMLSKLDDIKDNSGKKPTRLSRQRAKANSGGGGGTVDVIFDGPSPGVSWEVMRVATEVGGGAATKCRVYINDPGNPLNKAHVITDASDFADSSINNIYVPAGQKLIFRFLAVAVNQDVTVSLQVREFINPPALEVD